jgi:signal transduction histidine kinase
MTLKGLLLDKIFIVNRNHQLLFLLLFYFKITSTVAQILVFKSNNDVVRLDSGIYEFQEKQTTAISIEEAIRQQRQGRYSYVTKSIPSYWMSNEGHWLYFKLVNQSEQAIVLEINNVMIGELDSYLIEPDSVPKHLPASGWHVPVNNRIYHSYKSCYQLHLKINQAYEFFIRVKRSQLSMKVPIVLWNETVFLQFLYNENLKYGFFSGLVLFISVFSFVIYFYQRDKKYLFYSLYCISVLLWRLTVEGFALRFCQNNLFQIPLWSSVFNLFTAYFAMVFLEKFLLHKNSPQWHFAFNKFTRYGILFFLFPLFFYGETVLNTAISALYIFFICCVILNIIVFIYSGIKRKEMNAFIYLVSIFPILIYTCIVTVTNFFKLSPPLYFYDQFLWVLLFEIIVLSVGLAINFKKFVAEKEIMLQELNIKQREAFTMQVQLQEEGIKRAEAQVELKNEKERISRDLHDSIGTDLSNIIYNIEYIKYEFANNNDLSNAFEKLSLNAKHTMDQLRSAIWVLNHDNITLELFIKKLNSHIYRILEDKHEIQYSSLTNNKNKNTFIPVMHVLYLYRIVQESLSNTVKYAKATKIVLDIMLENNELQLIFADNGTGFNITDALEKETYGLKNITKRIEELGGKSKIKSSSSGTEIQMTIPLNKP